MRHLSVFESRISTKLAFRRPLALVRNLLAALLSCPPAHKEAQKKTRSASGDSPGGSGSSIKAVVSVAWVTRKLARLLASARSCDYHAQSEDNLASSQQDSKRASVVTRARYKARERYKPYEQRPQLQRRQATETLRPKLGREVAKQHRALRFSLTHDSPQKGRQNGPRRLKSWSDVERGRQSGHDGQCGLDDSEQPATSASAWQLIELPLGAHPSAKRRLPEKHARARQRRIRVIAPRPRRYRRQIVTSRKTGGL